MPKYRTERDVVVGNMEWLGSGHGIRNARTEILDISAFTPATHYPNGYLISGTALARVGGMVVPYAPGVSEVQTINLGAATAGTITITFDGATTGAIAYNATAATVQASLEALSNVNPGDVLVTGGPLPGTITLTFAGQYAGRDVPVVAVTPTALTGGTVTVATSTAGGPVVAGSEVLAGFLLTDQPLGVNPGATADATQDFNVPVLDHGRVKTGKLPFAFVAPTPANNKTTCVFI